MKKLKLSVVMITYGHEKFILKAVESIIEQETNFDFDLIIANDSSPDNTDGVIRELMSNHSEGYRIKYFSHIKNLGIMSNLLFALKQATGEFIALCEGDDYWRDAFKLQKQVEFLEKNPEYVVAFHDTIVVDEDGLTVETSKSRRRKKDLSSTELMKGATPATLSMCFRNVVAEYPKESLYVSNGDTFLASYLGTFGHGKYMGDIIPGAYRIHGGGIWSMVDRRKKLSAKIRTFAALKEFHKRIGNHEISRFYLNKVRNTYKMQLARSIKERRIKDMLRHSSALLSSFLK